jgi:hypothetical protein
MGAPTSSYTTVGIALKVSGALKPHHHDKVETPSMGPSYPISIYSYSPFILFVLASASTFYSSPPLLLVLFVVFLLFLVSFSS